MPRMTNDEFLAKLEAELAETKAKAEETIKAKIAATQAKLDEAKAKAETRKQDRIVKIDEQIATAKASRAKTDERISKLQAERDELTATEPDAEQPELPVTDPEVELSNIKAPSKRRADAA